MNRRGDSPIAQSCTLPYRRIAFCRAEACGLRRLVAAFTAGSTCRPGRTAFSGSRRSCVFSRVDGDKSPAKSGDESPHSKIVALRDDFRRCHSTETLRYGLTP
jgi:hypothetical protein